MTIPEHTVREAHRRIAQAADEDGREWEWEGGYPQKITRVGDVILVANTFESPDAPSRFAEFIATFDPPTVLELLADQDRFVAMNSELTRDYNALLIRNSRDKDERDRLREALEEIADWPFHRDNEAVRTMSGIAREALAANEVET